ncbi:hypothetical protein D9758_007679 [Tetrapyrgos nigripes]|uniref:Oxidoreductase n=1 Tax=Tetrapyrgos nigripes TaxID=182062 RepID=A0A8H5G5G6_9AGAR|nr:hypothetical protein D9758_007679 [Tetrapyrgos nigripes]
MLQGIAILGAGLFATQAYVPALVSLGKSSVPPPPLRAIYSRSEKSARELASVVVKSLNHQPDIYFDVPSSNSNATDSSESSMTNDSNFKGNLDALLSRSDIIAVIIVLPITIQPSIILKCLAAGKHVLSEKPIGADVKSGLQLIKDAAQYINKGLVWRIAENFECEDVYIKVGELVKEGKIGKIAFFKVVVFNYIDKTSQWYQTPWRTVPEYQGGFLLDGGVHTLAAMRTILSPSSFKITSIVGFSSLTKDYLMPHDTIHSVVQASSTSSSESIHGLVEMTFASPLPSRPPADNILITGTEGYISINSAPFTSEDGNEGPGFEIKLRRVVKKDEETDKVEEENEEVYSFPSKGVEGEFKSFFDACEGHGDVAVGKPEEALKDVAFIEAALKSGGQLIDLVEMVKG